MLISMALWASRHSEPLPVYNGAIEAMLRSYHLGHSSIIEVPLVTLEGAEVKVAVTSDHALQFAARLQQNGKSASQVGTKEQGARSPHYDADHARLCRRC